MCFVVLPKSSSKAIPQLMPSVVLTDRSEGYYRLWGKVRGIWKHLRSQHLHDFDWFLKADDDTYIVVDNLRSFLERRLSSTNAIAEGVWFGARLKNPKVTSGYHSGGAGYVLSRRALELFDDGRHCSQMNFGYEDLEMGESSFDVCLLRVFFSSSSSFFLPFCVSTWSFLLTSGIESGITNPITSAQAGSGGSSSIGCAPIGKCMVIATGKEVK